MMNKWKNTADHLVLFQRKIFRMKYNMHHCMQSSRHVFQALLEEVIAFIISEWLGLAHYLHA